MPKRDKWDISDNKKMVRLNSKPLRPIFISIIATLLINCSTQDKKENAEQISSLVDTLNYEKKDYDLMREYFSSDTVVLSNLNKGVEVGDTNSIKLNKLLASEYESRSKTGVTESEIDALIFSYYAIKKVSDKFEEIESRLQKSNGDAGAVQRRTDSLNTAIEKLKQEMKDLVKEN
jgi:flagellin-like hook-associated protein FlgL